MLTLLFTLAAIWTVFWFAMYLLDWGTPNSGTKTLCASCTDALGKGSSSAMSGAANSANAATSAATTATKQQNTNSSANTAVAKQSNSGASPSSANSAAANSAQSGNNAGNGASNNASAQSGNNAGNSASNNASPKSSNGANASGFAPAQRHTVTKAPSASTKKASANGANNSRFAPAQRHTVSKAPAANSASNANKANNVTPIAKVPVADKHDQANVTPLFEAPSGKDDLKVIKGIGVVMEKTLNDLGITTYKQLAGFQDAEVKMVSDVLSKANSGFGDRIDRDKWVPQAIVLAKAS